MMKLAVVLRRHPRLALAAALLLGLAATGAALTRSPTPAPAPAATPPAAALTVSVTRPRTQHWPMTISANGSITAWQEAVVGAEIGGLRLTELRVEIGDRVSKGEILARLQDDTVRAELAQTAASLEEAQAALQEATANADRARRVQGKGTLSEQQATAYLVAEKAAKARVAGLQAAVQNARLRPAQTRIAAPDDGTITHRLATLGAVVQTGDELFRLNRGDRLEWRAELPAAELAQIRPGMPVRLTTNAEQILDGTVRRIAPTLDAASRTGLVYVDLAAHPDIRAGMFAHGDIALGQAAVVTVPQRALLLRDGFHYLFLLADDQSLTQLKVTTGARRGDEIAILSPLPSDARVVDSGVGFLNDGDRVRVSTLGTSAAVGTGA
ncbi:efflux RND transporter periplasmic adaptor subunit [Pseudaeromonas paramecii]|uniref:Efflux RND transporter periplasmic adaptor subunit n=1 Tax=Pseudaeromonas paramecii TaxID=2138166 RepID=A0ABP8Q116_9GAMM